MPYIKPVNRVEHPYKPKTAGELNYRITLLVHTFIEDGGLTYDAINTVIGVLECAKLELYRMVAAPYEDAKRNINGPISELDGPQAPQLCSRLGSMTPKPTMSGVIGGNLADESSPHAPGGG